MNMKNWNNKFVIATCAMVWAYLICTWLLPSYNDWQMDKAVAAWEKAQAEYAYLEGKIFYVKSWDGDPLNQLDKLVLDYSEVGLSRQLALHELNDTWRQQLCFPTNDVPDKVTTYVDKRRPKTA